jgi:hypothetical protein
MEAGTTPAPEATGGSPQRSLLLAAGLGGAVALALGIYGNVHEPSKDLVFELFFTSTISMKVYFATAVLAFAVRRQDPEAPRRTSRSR